MLTHLLKITQLGPEPKSLASWSDAHSLLPEMPVILPEVA